MVSPPLLKGICAAEVIHVPHRMIDSWVKHDVCHPPADLGPNDCPPSSYLVVVPDVLKFLYANYRVSDIFWLKMMQLSYLRGRAVAYQEFGHPQPQVRHTGRL
jgi:hypothetical protein